MPKPRIRIPKTIAPGEPFQVKTLISHKMESGRRKNADTGEPVPRKIIHSFVCLLDGTEVFRAALHPAISANPYVAFFVTAQKDGELEFIWTDDDGTETRHTKPFKVQA